MRFPGKVIIVDDDDDMQQSLKRLLKAEGIATECYPSAEEFLAAAPGDGAACLVLDIRLLGMSGLDLQAELCRRGSQLPVILISGHANVPDSIRAFQQGASAFFEKPFGHREFISAVSSGLALAEQRYQRVQLLTELTPREQEVLHGLLAGQTVKEISQVLQISPSTAEKHRASILRKSQTESVVDLILRFHEASPRGHQPHLSLAGASSLAPSPGAPNDLGDSRPCSTRPR